MAKISRLDGIIGLTVVVVLLALLALAFANRSPPAQSAQSRAVPATRSTPTTDATPSNGASHGAPSPPRASASEGPGPSPASTVPASSSAGSPTSSPPTDRALPPVGGPVSAVGDSIMLDIQPYLEDDLPGVRVDGLVSRQFETGVGVVEAERRSGTLGNVLVIELGTNGSVTTSEFDAMMQAAAGVERVVFVNVDVPRSWEAPDNAVLAAGVARYPGVAVLADWNALSSPHPEWFTPDQVHLQPAGAQALAGLVARYA